MGTVWNCGSRDCPTHKLQTDVCARGVWFCGRRDPACWGHSSKVHRCSANYWKTLLPGESATFPYILKGYGAELKGNKAQLNRVFDSLAVKDERRALILAMAMIETYNLSPAIRDVKKDQNTDGSANASIFNLNEYMIRQLGYSGEIHRLDPLTSLPDVVRLINKGFDTWGIVRTLNTVRGGETGFNDGGKKYDFGYRNAVSTALRLMDDDPTLLSDERRVEMNVPYQ